jgi:hypothetical protein
MGQNEELACQEPSTKGPTPPLLSALHRGETDEAPIYKFVLTGGPCAGKTTSLDRLSTFFRCVSVCSITVSHTVTLTNS